MNTSAIINVCDWGSTGKIAFGLLSYLQKQGDKVVFCYGRGQKRDDSCFYRIDSSIEVYLHALDTLFTSRLNSSSYFATKRLIMYLRSLNVTDIYMINLHGKYLHEKLFLEYLIEDKINLVYIMADESAFLGNCSYSNGCEQYINGCYNCPQQKFYQHLLFPNVPAKAFKMKQNAYPKINVAFVAPEFVINTARKSPLMNGRLMEIVDEAIDVDKNRPKDAEDLKNELHIGKDKIVIVCVAKLNQPSKGAKYFIEAARKIEHDSRFVFIHIGHNCKYPDPLPANLITKGYVGNQDELTKYYSIADLFVFASVLDTMPNTCLEALACGSPLLCFDISGMPYLGDSSVLTLVEPRNVDALVDVIKKTPKKSQKVIDTCRAYALRRYDVSEYSKKLALIMNNLKKKYH